MIKYQLYKTKCKRCGKDIYTSNRSLYGLDELYAKYHGICEGCLTESERIELRDIFRRKYEKTKKI